MMENPNTERNVFIDYFPILAAEWGGNFLLFSGNQSDMNNCEHTLVSLLPLPPPT